MSELPAHREFRLTGRRVDVREQRLALPEQRPAGRVVAGGNAAVRRGEVRAVEDVEQLRDELDLVHTPEVEELREAQVDVGESGTVHLRDRGEAPPGANRVDRV